jgi:hypothetical protein
MQARHYRVDSLLLQSCSPSGELIREPVPLERLMLWCAGHPAQSRTARYLASLPASYAAKVGGAK